MFFLRRILIFVTAYLFGSAGSALATPPAYTPLLTSAMFDGVRADVSTAAVGIISILLIVVGVAILAKVLS